MSLSELKQNLNEEWKGNRALPTCMSIVDFLGSIDQEQLSFISFRTLANGIGRERVDEDLLSAVAILAGSPDAILETRAMFLSDDFEQEVSIDELEEARLHGAFVHPQTGELVNDFESQIVPFFTPSARFTSALNV